MMGKQSEVSTQTLAEKLKAMATNCQGHSLSLAIISLTNHSLTKDCTIIHDVIGTVGEICMLVKYSPKLKKMLQYIVENIEKEFEQSSMSGNQKLNKFCVTRWTIRAKFLRISWIIRSIVRVMSAIFKKKFRF